MCKVMEDMRIQERREAVMEIVLSMLKDEILSSEKIAEYAGLSLDEVKKLKAELTA